jgi:beta-galactosidase
MWSVGNEVPSQWGPEGVSELLQLQDLVHRLDPTRPVTCGMEKFDAVLSNGFGSAIDIPGFNYKPQYYDEAYNKLPQKLILGTETASTFSSRGIYYFPVIFRGQEMVYHPENQSSSYDNENSSWSNTPDLDFMMDDDKEYLIGQFVWTGFDYLGEPTPYDTDAWPSHSSTFGIIDLASIPKDRYYLYRSKWNETSPTLHILPHWNWKRREGQVTPIFVYTNYPKAELFINGKSQGIKEKNNTSMHTRYRLMWNETVYEPGEVKVIAYDRNGNTAAEKVIRTAGKPHHLVATPNQMEICADGEDLVYFTVQVADKDGNIVPADTRVVNFKVEGNGVFLATANGDPTSLRSFQKPEMDLFSGAATAIVKAGKTAGKLRFTVSAKGVKSAMAVIEVK